MASDNRQSKISVESKLSSSTHDTFVVALKEVSKHHEWNDPKIELADETTFFLGGELFISLFGKFDLVDVVLLVGFGRHDSKLTHFGVHGNGGVAVVSHDCEMDLKMTSKIQRC